MVRCNGLVVMEMGNGVSALFYLQSHIFLAFWDVRRHILSIYI